MKLNLKHFSSSQNCQKISLKTFMRSGVFLIAKNPFRLYWKSEVPMVMPCNLNSWGGIFRPAINTASFSLSALQRVFKLFWRVFVHWLQKLADGIVCPTNSRAIWPSVPTAQLLQAPSLCAVTDSSLPTLLDIARVGVWFKILNKNILTLTRQLVPSQWQAAWRWWIWEPHGSTAQLSMAHGGPGGCFMVLLHPGGAVKLKTMCP